jgi:hypothetical protein
MYRLILCLTVAMIFVSCGGDGGKAEVKVMGPSVYSDTFNRGINQLLDEYYALSESLVKWDSVGAELKAAALMEKIDSTRFDELKKDSALYKGAEAFRGPVKAELVRINSAVDITSKRMAFNNVSQQFYELLKSIKYDRSKIYLNECTMPYNGGGSGFWFSKSIDSLRNPYLGLHHPKYKKAMIDCGATRDSLNFITYR